MSDKSMGNDPLNEIFSGPADDRDLSEMVARDGQPLFTRLTAVLGVVALVLIGVIIGAHFESQNASANASSAAVSALRSAFGNRSAGATSTFGAGSFGGFAAPVAAGQIKLIDGTNIYVTTSTGGIVKVSTDATTRIRESATLTMSQLKIGDTVTVSGQSGTDGTVAATSISVGAAQNGTASPSAASKSSSPTAPSTTKPSASGSATPSATGSNRAAALIACMVKKGVTVDPTQGLRALRNSTDPKFQAAFAACRSSAFSGAGTSPTP